MKYERSKIKDPLTGIELRELLDYIDTLEAACQFAYKPLTDYALDHYLAKLREALDKGK